MIGFGALLRPGELLNLIAANFFSALQVLHTVGAGVDVIELCGGAARVSLIAVRRNLRAGGNFDLVTQCDLNDPECQRAVMVYTNTYEPLVAVLQPTCRPFGPMAHLNYQINYEAWRASYDDAVPHGRFCGRVALKQDMSGRYYLAEQPFPSWLWDEPPWPEVIARPGAESEIVHQCATGQKGPHGLPAKKPTEFKANSRLLLQPLERFKCDGKHQHDDLSGGGSGPLQLYTWKLAGAIVDGIVKLKDAVIGPRSAFPEVSAGPGPPDVDSGSGEQVAPRACLGCRRNRASIGPARNRIPRQC